MLWHPARTPTCARLFFLHSLTFTERYPGMRGVACLEFRASAACPYHPLRVFVSADLWGHPFIFPHCWWSRPRARVKNVFLGPLRAWRKYIQPRRPILHCGLLCLLSLNRIRETGTMTDKQTIDNCSSVPCTDLEQSSSTRQGRTAEQQEEVNADNMLTHWQGWRRSFMLNVNQSQLRVKVNHQSITTTNANHNK